MKPLGLILTGGQSQRMGKDKSSLQFEGASWADHAMKIVSPYVQENFLSVRKSDHHHPLAIRDEVENIGPAAGLLAAHHMRPECSWMVLAVDFPLATAASVEALIDQALHDRAEITCYGHDDQTPEPLFAVWSSRALRELELNVARGLTGPMATLKQVGFSMMRPLEMGCLKNINTPEQWRQAQDSLRSPSQF